MFNLFKKKAKEMSNTSTSNVTYNSYLKTDDIAIESNDSDKPFEYMKNMEESSTSEKCRKCGGRVNIELGLCHSCGLSIKQRGQEKLPIDVSNDQTEAYFVILDVIEFIIKRDLIKAELYLSNSILYKSSVFSEFELDQSLVRSTDRADRRYISYGELFDSAWLSISNSTHNWIGFYYDSMIRIHKKLRKKHRIFYNDYKTLYKVYQSVSRSRVGINVNVYELFQDDFSQEYPRFYFQVCEKNCLVLGQPNTTHEEYKKGWQESKYSMFSHFDMNCYDEDFKVAVTDENFRPLINELDYVINSPNKIDLGSIHNVYNLLVEALVNDFIINSGRGKKKISDSKRAYLENWNEELSKQLLEVFCRCKQDNNSEIDCLVDNMVVLFNEVLIRLKEDINYDYYYAQIANLVLNIKKVYSCDKVDSYLNDLILHCDDDNFMIRPFYKDKIKQFIQF